MQKSNPMYYREALPGYVHDLVAPGYASYIAPQYYAYWHNFVGAGQTAYEWLSAEPFQCPEGCFCPDCKLSGIFDENPHPQDRTP